MLQHVFHMLVNEWQLGYRMVPQLLKMWLVVTCVNAVGYNAGTTNVEL